MDRQIAGFMLSWNVQKASITFQMVREQLARHQFDPDLANELKPTTAFNRAMKSLKKNRQIDRVSRHGSSIRFQLTYKAVKNEEIVFQKDVFLTLNTEVGFILCPENIEMQKAASRLFRNEMMTRTESDVTKIVEKIFQKQLISQERTGEEMNDMFSLNPVKGGTYFVPCRDTSFVENVTDFLQSIGGYVIKVPWYVGDKDTDEAIATVVDSELNKMLKDLDNVSKKFSGATRQSTMEGTMKDWQTIRVKIESYAAFLGAKKEELLLQAEKTRAEIQMRIMSAQTMPKNDGPVDRVFGKSATSVIRWMGSQGFTVGKVQKVLKSLGVADVKEQTIRTSLSIGRSGNGKMPELTEEEIEKLNVAANA